MKVQYITNLNCGSCVAAVKPYLDGDPAISRWSVDTSRPEKVLTVEGSSVSMPQIAGHLLAAGFQVLGVLDPTLAQPILVQLQPPSPVQKGWFATYWPLLLVLVYLLGFVAGVEFLAGKFDESRAMSNFMGGFFVVFSFFKMLDIAAFAQSYRSYDLITAAFAPYGYAYPFIELVLGVAYLFQLVPLLTNVVTLVLMIIGVAGVLRALVQRRQIQCACLGTVFNLPMSSVTLAEDAVMGVMALLAIVSIAMR